MWARAERGTASRMCSTTSAPGSVQATLTSPLILPPSSSQPTALAPSSAARASCERRGRCLSSHVVRAKMRLQGWGRKALPSLAHGPPDCTPRSPLDEGCANSLHCHPTSHYVETAES